MLGRRIAGGAWSAIGSRMNEPRNSHTDAALPEGERIDERVTEEIIARESPEGRRPGRRGRRLSVLALVGVLALFVIAVIVAFLVLDPMVATVATLIILVVYALSAAPVLGAGVLRRKEHRVAETRVREGGRGGARGGLSDGDG